MSDMVRAFDVVRVRGGRRGEDLDRAATEEPLEIRLHDRPYVVVMRTPGADRELAAGFLLAERVIRNADDLGAIAHCTDASADHRENVVNVRLVDSRRADEALAGARQVTAASSCGVCGRRSIDTLIENLPTIASAMTIGSGVLAALPARLRQSQTAFDETGGLHAAGLFSADGDLLVVAEDVGRHNAVDKVIGRMLLAEHLPLADAALCVSGRASFEIVQKAVLAGIAVVAAVSAPSTLAIDLARDAGVTLAGFVRGDSFNIYTHPRRIA